MWKYAVCSSTSTSTRCTRFPANASGASGSGTRPLSAVRLVVLVTVVIDQNDDPLELGQDVEEVPADELRVLERDLRGRERLRHAAGDVHRVQAQVAGKVETKTSDSPAQLRLDVESGGEQRLDPARAQPSSGVHDRPRLGLGGYRLEHRFEIIEFA